LADIVGSLLVRSFSPFISLQIFEVFVISDFSFYVKITFLRTIFYNETGQKMAPIVAWIII